MYHNDCERFHDGWRIIHDPEDTGKKEEWFKTGIPTEGAKDAFVPSFAHQFFYYEHGIFWYEKKFRTQLRASDLETFILRIGAADFRCETYLNGILLGVHIGTEDPFSYDVSDVIRPEEENLLVFRISKPWDKEVDGYRFGEVPHRNQRPNDIWPGTCYNECGFSGEINLTVVPKLRISDMFVHGNMKTNAVDITYTIHSDLEESCVTTITTSVGNKRTGELCNRVQLVARVEKGELSVSVSVPLNDVRLWSCDDPFLYYVNAELTCGEKPTQLLCKHTGFRDFRVGEDGFFRLNGKRIFMRCSHTGNYMPFSTHQIPYEPWLVRRDLDMAKASGLNTIRFISGVAMPDQLDYCDEIGLMVYEEPVASWLTENGSRSKELYQNAILKMVLRDRSHPSICVWGMLNETVPTPPFDECCRWGRETLMPLRALDRTRLVLYSSGRFDGDAFTGSVSNPDSDKWECLWNKESEDNPEHVGWKPGNPGAFFENVGDIHCYPRNPVSKYDRNLLRTVGCDVKRPVFLSENGCGSLFDVVWLVKKFEQMGVSRDLPDVRQIYMMYNHYMDDLKKYGFDREYAFPGDILHESQRLHCKQRRLAFNMVRSNPYMCGYSITGLLDHSICGEGLWTFFREWKPGIVDAMQEGLAPLKWCLFLDDTHIYAGKPVRVEAILANEDILCEKDYPVHMRILGEDGIVYEKSAVLHPTAEQLKAFAVPVFDELITLNVPTGRYELHCDIEGAAAMDSRQDFYVTDSADIKAAPIHVAAWGLNEATERFLAEKGVTVTPLSDADPAEPALILVGDGPAEEKEPIWNKIYAMAEAGSRAFIASRLALCGPDGWSHYLRIEQKPENYPPYVGFVDWLYHKEYLAKRKHPYFKDMPCGIMDWDYWIYMINGADFRNSPAPDEVASASFGPGNINEQGYEGGFNIGTYRIGKGALILNSYNLVENIGLNPAADHLMINILNEEANRL